jgi:thiol-disulfide isomerase/thioredoxin
MKIISLLLGIFGLLSSSYAQYTLTGQFDNLEEGQVYLSYLDKKDSATVREGHFSFNFTVDYPVEAYLIVDGGVMASPLYLEEQDLILQVTLLNGEATYITQIEESRFLEEASQFEKIMESTEDPAEMKEKLYKQLEEMIKRNPEAQYAGMILSEFLMEPLFSYEEASALTGLLDQSKQDDFDMETIRVSLQKLQNIKEGSKIEDFALPTLDGELARLSDQDAEYVLIEIWGSWCGPCRAANPELKKVYDRHTDRGFEIYGIAIDRNMMDMQRAIEEDQLKWVNTFAEGMWRNSVVKDILAIQFVPYNYLVDREQRIVAMNLSPEELDEKLSDLLSR